MLSSYDRQAPRTPAQPAAGPAEPDAAWEATVAAALTPALASAKPSEAFVAHLGRQLSAAAQRDAQEQKTREQRLRIAGAVGGVISLVGGLVFWLVWRQHHKPGEGAKPGWALGLKSLSRAHSANAPQ